MVQETVQNPAAETAENPPSAPAKRSRKIAFAVTAIFLGFFICYCLVELVLRWMIPCPLGTNQSAIFALDPLLGWSIEPNLEVCFIGADGGISWKRSNRIGTLGPDVDLPKPKGTMRVLAAGDSHIHSTLSEKKTFTASLQKILAKSYLHADVINAAVGSYSPYQQLLRVLTLADSTNPDAIVWCFYGGNDLVDCELSDGPAMNDYMQGRLAPLEADSRPLVFQQPDDNHFRGPVWRFLTDHFRFFDLVDYLIFVNRPALSWKKNAEAVYKQRQTGPLSNLSLERIKEIIPDAKAHIAWSSWYAQGAKQNQYFFLHPERTAIAKCKFRAIIAAFGVLQARKNMPVYMLYIPNFLQSLTAAEKPFSTFSQTILMSDLAFDEELKRLARSWCKQAGIKFFDGLQMLQSQPSPKEWFERTDGHITKEAQRILAERMAPEINRVNIVKRSYFAIPSQFLNNLPEREREFAFHPWPGAPMWKETPQEKEDAYPVHLKRILAMATPGPWVAGSVWKFMEVPKKDLFIDFWQTNAEKKETLVHRQKVKLNGNNLEPIVWSTPSWYNKTPIPNLPASVSLNYADGEAASPKYTIQWQ
ncbi:MAG: SGNH/GDSL hydrolase family protein [Candidatus Omnitrophota bacterium]